MCVFYSGILNTSFGFRDLATRRFYDSQPNHQRNSNPGPQVSLNLLVSHQARRVTRADCSPFCISDGVLNPSGVRFGSGEIYTVMEQFSDFIDDCLCIGQRRQQDKDERVLLFLKMRPHHKFTPELVTNIKTAIKKGLSARHVPAYIFETSDIPVSWFFLFANTMAKSNTFSLAVYG